MVQFGVSDAKEGVSAVKEGVSAVEQAMNLGREAAEYISETFTKVTVYFAFYFILL